ncbi:MAG: FkbM family methyltransferase, partial [Bacteroidetes bacterium]|nr:FkbM family methyltransferase [Bacteroidota bacterium]
NTKLYQNVVPLQAGLWPEAKKLNVTNTNSSSWAFTLEESKEDIPNTLDAITLDELLTRYGQQYIDILKIDIEGAEKELFSTNYQTWLPRTKVIVIELHDRMRRGCSKAFFKALINYDFRVQLKGENLVCINDALI